MSQDSAANDQQTAGVDESLLDLVPQEVVVPIPSLKEEVTVRPFKFGQLPRVLKHISALMRFVKPEGGFDVKSAFLFGGEDILALICEATKKPRTWLDEIGMDEGVALTGAVVSQNLDFFVQHVVPTIQTLKTQLTAAASKAKAATAEATGRTSTTD